jgi:hypothetical protein
MISLTVGVSLKPKWAMIRLRSRRKRPLTAAEFAGRPDCHLDESYDVHHNGRLMLPLAGELEDESDCC